MKIVKSLEELVLLIMRINEAIKNAVKEQKDVLRYISFKFIGKCVSRQTSNTWARGNKSK